MANINFQRQSQKEEIANSITHGIGLLLSISGLVLLIVVACIRSSIWHIVSFSIFGVGMILVYTSSTLFHSFKNVKVKSILNIIDHSAVYILIAATYTPFTLVTLRGPWGWSIFGVVWGAAIAGIILKVFFIGQSIFYLIAFIGFFGEKKGFSNMILYTPFYFCLVNFASMKGIIEYIIKRKTIIAWEPIRTKNS